MNIIKLHLCHNDTVLIFVIRMISIIQTRIQTSMAKGVQIIKVSLYIQTDTTERITLLRIRTQGRKGFVSPSEVLQ